MEREMAAKYERDHPSEYFGTVGKREIFTLTVIGMKDIESDFGSTTLYMFRDLAGNRAKWFCSCGTSLGVDVTYTVKATVKAHDEYRGSRQTLLSRLVVYDAQAEFDAKEARKQAKKAAKSALVQTKQEVGA